MTLQLKQVSRLILSLRLVRLVKDELLTLFGGPEECPTDWSRFIRTLRLRFDRTETPNAFE